VTSLGPEREERTVLTSLGGPEIVEGLVRIDAAMRRHFPENLFDDLDALAGALAERRDALAHAARIAHVHALFGGESKLCFRYAHDFLYGFDWARWVAREPLTRASVGPYDDAFVAYSEQRAAELCVLVDRHDPKYGPIAAGTHRNPFPFRRDLESERRLHRSLAASGDVPVQAWDRTSIPVWNRPFTALREARARELGLSIDASAPD